MNGTGQTVIIKSWGCLGTKKGVLYEERGELKFTDGFHDRKMTQARIKEFAPGGDTVLEKTYRRIRGTRSWHLVTKELKKLLDEGSGKTV